MTDETPAAPRRNHRPATPEPGEGLVGVMAGEPDASAGDPAMTAGEPISPVAPAGPPQVLRVERGGIAEATAGSVEVRMGGIGALSAEEVFVQLGGIGAARADRIDVHLGSLGAGLAGEVRVRQGIAGSVVAREATVEQSLVRTLLAQRVTITRPTGVLVMIAQHVSGDVRPVMDWRGALAFGAAFGLVSVAGQALRRRR
jgi:hypothetical protein